MKMIDTRVEDPTLPDEVWVTDPVRSLFDSATAQSELADKLMRDRVLAQVYGGERETTLGEYVVEAQLGRGGMGEVYAARNAMTSQPVAIKVLRKSEDVEAERKALVSEARSMAKIRSRHVVRLYGVGRDGERLFIIMERVEGPTLKAWLDEERSLEDILRVFVQAARGLAAAHDVGVLHRDFKPANVFVDVDGDVLVGDFGLAGSFQIDAEFDPSYSIIEEATHRGVGTLAYMAPEQLLDESASEASDQFSFFLALFEAIYGKPAFPLDTIEARVEALETCTLEFPADRRVAKRLRDVIERGLSRDPAERHASMADVVEVLEHKPDRPGRIARWVGAAVLVGVAATSVWLTARWPSPIDEQWTDERRDAIATNQAIVGAALADNLDDYAEAWARVYRSTTDPAARRCLLGGAERFDALTEELATSDVSARAAFEAVATLPTPTSCVGSSLAAPEELDVEHRRTINEALEGATLARLDGEFELAVELAEESLELAVKASWEGARVDALEQLALARHAQGETSEALVDLQDARTMAMAARATERAGELSLELALIATRDTPERQRNGWLELAGLAGDGPRTELRRVLAEVRELTWDREYAEAEMILEQALARYEGLGYDEPYLELELRRRYADAIAGQGKDRRLEAMAAYDRALDYAAASLGDGPALAVAKAELWDSVGTEAFVANELELAAMFYDRAHQVRVDNLGHEHPEVGRSFVDRSYLNLKMRDYEAALDSSLRAVELLGEGHDFLPDAYLVLGHSYVGLERPEEALQAFETCVRLNPDHTIGAHSKAERARLLVDIDRGEEAVALYEEAMPVMEAEAWRLEQFDDLFQVWQTWLQILAHVDSDRAEKEFERAGNYPNWSTEQLEALHDAALGIE